MTKPRLITFRVLVDQEYRANGYTLKGALCQIHNLSGVSVKTVEAAYKETSIHGRTAKKLVDKLEGVHKGIKLDFVALVTAPTKKRRKAV